MPNPTSYEGGTKESLSISALGDMFFRQCWLDNFPAGAYTCDSRGLITYFNQQAARLWGREPRLRDSTERFCGSFKLFSADGSPLAYDQCGVALALKEEKECKGQEIIIERPDGERISVLIYSSPIYDDAGDFVGVINVLINISERKQTEDTLRKADQSKNAFLAMLAHELRNPLAPLRNATEILHLKMPPVPELQWALEVIDRQMQQMTRLVDDLLDLGRITSNKLDLRKDRISLGAVLRAAVEISQPNIQAGNQTLTFDEPADDIFLHGDLTRLTQVVANLLHNASKYSARGGQIWLSTENCENEIVIRVRDMGIGIPAIMLPRIFDMFTQADQPSDWSPGGLGIGLTLARQVVEVHGGIITVRSEGHGCGSEFIVQLPVVDLPQQVPLHDSVAEHKAAYFTSELRVLVVDDNKDSTDSLVMLLELMGNDVQTARDGHEAMDVAEAFRPHVMVLDIGMPKLNGYDTACRIRAQPWGGDIILIACTGWGQDTDRQRSCEAGFDHHMVKPVDPQALMQLISSVGNRGLKSSDTKNGV